MVLVEVSSSIWLTPGRSNIGTTHINDLVFVYLWLRTRRAKRKAEYCESNASDKAMQETIEAELLTYLDESGANSAKSEIGTAYNPPI